MSSKEKKSESNTKKATGINSDMDVDDANKSIETTDKSDGHNTSVTSVERKVSKKKKLKSPPSGQPHNKKMKKDPNKPEYPKVGYVRYMNVRRDELRKDFPDMHHLDVTKKIGEEWMTMDEKTKQPYLDAAKDDKIRYKQEMKAYNKKLKNDEAASVSKGKKKSTKVAKDANTSESMIEETPKKKKKKTATSTGQTNGIESKSPQKSTLPSIASKKMPPIVEQQPSASSTSLLNTPPPTPPQTDGAPIFGDIPIFTEKFLEHNRQMETELKKIRKMNTDYEQQNAVLEKHVENVRAGITKTNTEIDELRKENDKLSSYLEMLRHKLATQLRNLSIPSEPNGANIENIDKYMNDLYEMAKDNSHGPASLNKAKDLLRKVDLNIDLKAFHQSNQ